MENANLQTNVTHVNNPVKEYMYQTYHGKGAHVEVYIPALILFASMLVGYVGNGLVILATYKNKALHGSCNYLLCLACLGDILHQTGHWPFTYLVVTGQNFMRYDLCLYMQTVPILGLNMSIFGTLFVGTDRLIGVLFPTSYRHINTKVYMAICLSIVALVDAYFIYLPYYYLPRVKDREIMCNIIDGMGEQTSEQWFPICVLINFMDLIIYTAVWILIRFRAGTSDSMRKVFRSLQVIMFTVVGGWLINAFVMALVPLFQVPVSKIYYVQIYFGFLPNFASAANFIPLYVFSQEYRQTFQQILAPICPCINVQKIQQVTTMDGSKAENTVHAQTV